MVRREKIFNCSVPDKENIEFCVRRKKILNFRDLQTEILIFGGPGARPESPGEGRSPAGEPRLRSEPAGDTQEMSGARPESPGAGRSPAGEPRLRSGTGRRAQTHVGGGLSGRWKSSPLISSL